MICFLKRVKEKKKKKKADSSNVCVCVYIFLADVCTRISLDSPLNIEQDVAVSPSACVSRRSTILTNDSHAPFN